LVDPVKYYPPLDRNICRIMLPSNRGSSWWDVWTQQICGIAMMVSSWSQSTECCTFDQFWLELKGFVFVFTIMLHHTVITMFF